MENMLERIKSRLEGAEQISDLLKATKLDSKYNNK